MQDLIKRYFWVVGVAEVLGLDDVRGGLGREHGADHDDHGPEDPEVALDEVLHRRSSISL